MKKTVYTPGIYRAKAHEGDNANWKKYREFLAMNYHIIQIEYLDSYAHDGINRESILKNYFTIHFLLTLSLAVMLKKNLTLLDN